MQEAERKNNRMNISALLHQWLKTSGSLPVNVSTVSYGRQIYIFTIPQIKRYSI